MQGVVGVLTDASSGSVTSTMASLGTTDPDVSAAASASLHVPPVRYLSYLERALERKIVNVFLGLQVNPLLLQADSLRSTV